MNEPLVRVLRKCVSVAGQKISGYIPSGYMCAGKGDVMAKAEQGENTAQGVKTPATLGAASHEP